MGLVIKGGRVLDPHQGLDAITDVRIEDGVIRQIGETLVQPQDQVIDAEGQWVMPGFIDMHVHLRDPGLTYKEDIESGSRAAAAGGFTTVVAMPNTKPVADSAEVVRYVQEKAAEIGLTNVYQVGAVTKGQGGFALADIEEMAAAGCVAISEDGKSVMDAALYEQAMELAAKHDMAVLAHCEDIDLVRGGVMNADAKAKELGLPGITNEVEDVIVARDIELAAKTGARLHLCHCSTAGSVELVRQAKARGLQVTAEVCPHHFMLTTDDIPADDGNYKMNPPLRTREDVEALQKGLSEGIMDCIATDHAPHSPEEKCRSFREAPFGIVGLETAASLTNTYLVEAGLLTPLQMAQRLSTAPAAILKNGKGRLEIGATADVVIFDPQQTTVVDPQRFYSKGKNTPFTGMELRGVVTHTLLAGRTVFEQKKEEVR